MNRTVSLPLALFAALLLCFAAPVAADLTDTVIRHDLKVRIDPEAHAIEIEDALTFPAEFLEALDRSGEVTFSMHGNLKIGKVAGPYLVEPKGDAVMHGVLPLREYTLRATSTEGDRTLRVEMAGTIHHPIVQGEESARSFSVSPGLISEEGISLSGSTEWLPRFGDRLVTFRLAVELPEGWDVVSQGERVEHVVRDARRHVAWDCRHPMDEVYLVAARFHEFSRAAGAVTAFAFLREPDKNLANQYLEATAQYVQMYSQLLGPYPYSKFALVENFWETGYGMPSFTLLGPTVIRLPFILHTSYPHEILHNWWGNSVFVDWETGNWCEGLTAYMADFLLKEGSGKGHEYRRDTLKKYKNFVRDARDFPLTEFRSRHSEATESVGYGKSLMMFHMLRREVGDEMFSLAMRRFYREMSFKRAGFTDLERVFSRTTETDLRGFFEQWVGRTGAPELAIGSIQVREARRLLGGRTSAEIELVQLQEGPPYKLNVPVAFQIEGRDEAYVESVDFWAKSARFTIDLPGKPIAVAVDPEFDVFRRLHRAEIPSSIGQLFGAEHTTIVLPERDREAWRALADAWSGRGDVIIVDEEDLATIPDDRAVWILGAQNRHGIAQASVFEELGAGVRGGTNVSFGAEQVARAGHSFVLTASHPAEPELAIGWVGADPLAAIPGLARKLPHYGKYSYLAFKGDEPSNVVKGQWSAIGSPLVAMLDKSSAPAPMTFAEREPLARPGTVFNPDRMRAHVETLAAADMDGRGPGTPGIDRAAEYIARVFERIGLEPGADGGGWLQKWTMQSGPDGKPVEVANVIGVLRGKSEKLARQSVVIGAHYDHLGYGWPDARSGAEGKLHPGADDNASGIAVMLEVAELLATQLEPQRTVVFVAFSAEECGLQGSRHYVEAMKQWPAREALAMVNLDSVGRLEGRKLTVLGTGSATEWVHINRGIGFTTGVESTSVADDFGSSDQKSFLDIGVPAVQIFGGAHVDYHRPSDTADKIDVDGMIRTATFLRETVVYLANREEPMTSTLEVSAGDGGPPVARPATRPGSSRRVSLGTMPDFAFRGPGVRVESVLPDTPAAKAGLEAGDLVLAIDGKEISDLKGYSDALKACAPGDTIEIRLRRGDQERTVQAKLIAR